MIVQNFKILTPPALTAVGNKIIASFDVAFSELTVCACVLVDATSGHRIIWGPQSSKAGRPGVVFHPDIRHAVLVAANDLYRAATWQEAA